MLVYRIQSPIYAADCLRGEGARRVGGRWNRPGTPLVYAATTPELALLETLVHLGTTSAAEQPPLVLITIEVPDELLQTLPVAELPEGWDRLPATTEVAAFLAPRLAPAHPVLGWLVPSAVLPASPSRCALLNPLHRWADRLRIVSTEPLQIDPRLLLT